MIDLVPPEGSIVRDVLAQKLLIGDWIPKPGYGWRQVSHVQLGAYVIDVTFTDDSTFEFGPFYRVRVKR